MQSLARRLATAPQHPWPDRPIPLALVITELDIGGAERAMVSLATGLDRRRWAPSVIGLGPEGPLALPIRASGIPVRCLDVDSRAPLRAVFRLAAALRAIRPWLAQSFLFHANIATRLASPMAGWPWVVGGVRVAERRQNAHLRIDRLTRRRISAGSVCVSEGVRRFSQEVGRLDSDRLVVIPNGIDPEAIDREEAAQREAIGVPPEAPLALFVGRLEPQKGLPILLDAARRVIAARPDWYLVLVGDGPEGPWLSDQIASDPALRNRARWLGRRDDVPALLKASDLLVLPSLWEGMPNVVLEAMAAQRAVVATKVEGTEDLVVPGETGWLVPSGDASALANALLEAANAPERTRRFGNAGRARVESHFTRGHVIESYEQLWARLLGLAWPPVDGGL